MTLPGVPGDHRLLVQILAREIMGWEPEPIRSPVREKQEGWKYGPLRLYNDDSPYISKHEGWNPLENIADAWMLAEKLKLTVTPQGAKWGCAHCNWSQSTTYPDGTTAVGMTNGHDWYIGDTAPIAITLAAYAEFVERRGR